MVAASVAPKAHVQPTVVRVSPPIELCSAEQGKHNTRPCVRESAERQREVYLWARDLILVRGEVRVGDFYVIPLRQV